MKTIRRASMEYYSGYGPFHSIRVTVAEVEKALGVSVTDNVRRRPGWEQCVARGPERWPVGRAELWLQNVSGTHFLCCHSHELEQWPAALGVTVETPKRLKANDA